MVKDAEPRSERLLEGKVAIVTGGASGIGKAIVREFLREGAKVAIFDIADKSSVNDLLEEFDEVEYFGVDITNAEQVSKGFVAVQSRLGPVDILVNNAGIDPKEEYVTLHNIGIWDEVIATNLRGAFLMTREASYLMKEFRKQGNIIFIATVHTEQAFKGEAAYGASKHGLIGLMRTAAAELAKDGIRVNAISPGAIHPTGISESLTQHDLERLAKVIPAGRVGKPEEIATVAAFLASEKASYINGAEIRVDGGLSIITPLQV